MNDLDVVRELRATVPEPSSARMAVGKGQLIVAIQARGNRAPRRRLVTLVAVSAAAAAVAVAVIPGNDRTGQRPHRPVAVERFNAVLSVKVLRLAAAAAARSHAAEPAAGQWFFSKTVDYEFGRKPATTVDEEWGTFDGGYTAYRQGGQLVVHHNPGAISGGEPSALDRFDFTATPRSAYQALAALPRNPARLLAVISAHVARLSPAQVLSPIELYAPTSANQLVFSYLTELLWNASDGGPPSAEASVYLAMAKLPGVSVQRGITDAAGQPVIGLSDNHGIDQLLLDPRTYQVVGIREVSTGVSPAHLASKPRSAVTWPPKGAVVESLAIARLKPVSGPGRR